MKKQKTRYPGVTRLENAKFEIRVKIINPKTGKEKDIKRVIEAANPSAAAAMREELRTEATSDPLSMQERVRLADYATSWLNTKLGSLKPSTADRYASTLDLHILPMLGDYFVDAIEPADIRVWLDKQKGKPATVNGRLRVLKTLLADAAFELALPRNPAERIPALRMKRDEDDPNRLQADELAKVLAVFEETEPEWYPLVLLIAVTGMRFGEATALKWKDIDEQAGLIHVRRSQWKTVVTDTKTGSRRTVPLPTVLSKTIRKHRQRLLKRQAPGLSSGWVFVNRKGRLYSTTALQKPIERVMRKVEITRRQTTHGFRRTFNNLVRQFTTGEVVRAMTGHVTEAMTMHYSHVETEEKRTAVDLVLASMAPKVEGQVEGRGPDATSAGEDESPTGRNL